MTSVDKQNNPPCTVLILAPSLRIMDARSNSWVTVSQPIFHIITGLLMAVLYTLALEPKMPGRPFSKGLAYGTAIWA
jgi:hypothetical protein